MADPTPTDSRATRRAALEAAYPRYYRNAEGDEHNDRVYDRAIKFALRNPRGLRALADASTGWTPTLSAEQLLLIPHFQCGDVIHFLPEMSGCPCTICGTLQRADDIKDGHAPDDRQLRPMTEEEQRVWRI